MARVTTYATLATAVQEYLARTDVGVASGNLDYLCAEAEQEMNARLRVRRMLTSVTPTVSSAGVVTLPTDYRGWQRFTVRDGNSEWDLDLKSAEQKPEIQSSYTTDGKPRALITVGATSQIWPYTDGFYTFVASYYAMVPQLTSGAGTNWVITNFPMAYLYGCLAAARGFMLDDSPAMQSRFDVWTKRFSHVLDQIEAEDARDLDARTHATLDADTSLFRGGERSNIQADT